MKKLTKGLLCIAALLVMTVIILPAMAGGLEDSAWPKFGYDLNNTGKSAYAGPGYTTITTTSGSVPDTAPVHVASGNVIDVYPGEGFDMRTLVNSASAGDTLYFHNGVYNITSSSPVDIDDLTFRGEDVSKVIFNMSGLSGQFCLDIHSSGVTIDKITFKNASLSSGVIITGYGWTGRITNCIFDNIKNTRCIYDKNGSSLIEGNKFIDCTGLTPGIYFAGPNIVFMNNTFIRCEGLAFRFSKDKATDCTIAYNDIDVNGTFLYFYKTTVDDLNTSIYMNNIVNITTFAGAKSGSIPSNTTWTSPSMEYTYNGNTYTGELGNYWSGYTGADGDTNGIGDTAYTIPDGLGNDSAPLMASYKAYLGGGILSSLRVTPAETELAAGETCTFTATGYDNLGDEVPGTSFEWTSTDESVGTVDASGVFTAAGAGYTVVTATSGSSSDTALVHVTGNVIDVYPEDDFDFYTVVGSASAGDTLYFHSGTYNIDSTATVSGQDGLTLKGEDVSEVIFNMSSGKRLGVQSSDVTIDSITFKDADGTTYIVGLTSGSGLSITNCIFENIKDSYCIYSRGSALIDGNRFIDCTALRGICFRGSGILFTNNTISECEGVGFYMYKDDATDCTIVYNDIDVNGTLLYFRQTTSDDLNPSIYMNNIVNITTYAESSDPSTYIIPSQTTWTSPSMTYTYNDNTHTGKLGNYWSGYTGADDDGNGIGDTSYMIPDGLGNDTAPLMASYKTYLAGGELTSVKVKPAGGAGVVVGKTCTFTAGGYDSAGDEVPGLSFDWTSSDESVGTVDSSGVFTALSTGYTVITATNGSYSDSVVVCVTSLSTIEVAPSEAVVPAGETRTFSATGYDKDGDEISGFSFDWTSGNETVGTIDSSGEFTALSEGSTTVTAANGSVSGEATVSVVVPPEAAFEASPLFGDTPLTVMFTDQSTKSPAAWAWDFDNDGTVDSTERNPTYTYSEVGNYSVNLTVSNAAGNDSEIKTDYVTVGEAGTYGLANTPWPKFQAGINNSGQSPYIGPQTNTTIWSYRYTTYTASCSSPVIGVNGTIYIVGSSSVYALNPDGTVKWTYGVNVGSGAAIGADGTIYVGDYYSGEIDALNPNGTLRWSYTTSGEVAGSPAIGRDGTIYIGSKDKKLYALNPDGTLRWKYSTKYRIENTPAIGTDGTIYITDGVRAYALNPDGTLKWMYTTKSADTSPSIGSDGTIYIGSSSGCLYALNPDGTLKWSCNTDRIYDCAPAIAADGTIYIGSNSGKFYAVNPDGTIKWTYTTGSYKFKSAAVIGADGTVYIGCDDESIYSIYAFSPDGTLKWTCNLGLSDRQAPGMTSPAIGADGTLYIGNNYYADGRLYAFKDMTPVASFTATPLADDSLTVQFNDTSIYYPTSWSWDFGDGENSTETSPLHTYAEAGNYTVTLTVANDCGNDSMTKTQRVVDADVTSITISPTSAWLYQGETVQFSAAAFDQLGNSIPDAGFTWTSSNETVGTINTSGLFTSLAPGMANVSVSSGSVGVSAEVTVVKPSPDLILSSVASTAYPISCNTITATIENQGTVDAGTFTVDFTVEGNTTNVTVPELGAGNSTTVSGTDIARWKSGDTIQIKVAVDPANAVAESNETNNGYTKNVTISTTGELYQGGRFSNGNDRVNTEVYEEGNVGVAIALSGSYNSVYLAYSGITVNRTFSADSLNIPAGATIKSARLYQGWSWYGDPIFNLEFNGHESQESTVSYKDAINGQNVFDVTSYLNATGENTAVLTSTRSSGSDYAYYGTVLVVVYEDESEPYRQIWVNEGSDCLLYGTDDPYVGYTIIDNVSTADMVSGEITTVIESGDNNAQETIVFNGDTVSRTGKSGADPAFFYYDVNGALQDGTNELGVRGEKDSDGYENYINYALSVLEVTKMTASEADFTSNTTYGSAPLTVQFTDTSSGTPTSWAWNFGDGNTSTEQNPVYTYMTEGNYTVTLTVENSLGTNSTSKQNYISVGEFVPAPVADFTASTRAGTAPLTVSFSDLSTNAPTDWLWDFGDGVTSTEENPVHTYETIGTYDVTLTATNYGGSDTKAEEGYISVTSSEEPPVASFTTDSTTGQVPYTVQFTDTTTGAVNSWTWDFGDGGTSTRQNPVHTFVTEGNHTITLAATGHGGTTTATGTINATAPLTSESYIGGIPLTAVRAGNVSGGLWYDSYYDMETSADKTFVLPDYTDIKWARLYVAVYCGHMQNNYRGKVTIEIDADGDSTYELSEHETFNTTYSFPGEDGTGPVWLNDHMNRITSDYLMWYDLTEAITGSEVNVKAESQDIDTSFDGRVKAMTLLVAYDDGDMDEVYYWVNQGHDTVNPLDDGYTGSTEFDTAGLADGFDSANLAAIYYASHNGEYAFDGTALSSGTPQGSYFGTDEWDVSSILKSGETNTLAYDRSGTNYYKIPLALLTVRYAGEVPVANFTGTPTSGDAPLTVQFTDISTNATGWFWDFGDNMTSNESNPSHTYTTAGTYDVNLTATNAYGSDSETKTGYITVTAGGTTGGLVDSAWPKYHYDLNNTGQSPYIGPQDNNIVWTYNAGGSLQYNSPAIGADGTLYTGSCGTHEFYAINPNGTLKWTFSVGYTWQRFYGSPAIGTDGTIYTGNRDGNLYALNPDGTLKWSYATTNDIFKSPTIGTDGTVYIASCDGYLHAVNPDGTFKWKVRWSGSHEAVDLIGSPAIGSDGTIYIGSSSEAVFHAFNPDGTEKWNYTTTDSIYGSPAIGSDGTVYIGDKGGSFSAINPDGTLKWNYTTGYDVFGKFTNEPIYSTAAIGPDGTLYVGAAYGHVYAINPDGTLKWKNSINNYIDGSPAIGADGTVYVVNYQGRVCALNPDGTLKWDSNIGGSYCSPAIGSDSTLYICAGNALYAFRTEAPVANFSAEPTSGDVHLTVRFTDESTKNPTSWVWDFGDGDDTNATMQNPVHTYNAAGTYTVNLTATNIAGNTTESKTGYITVVEAVIPVANFSAEPTTGDVPLTVRFTDESANNPTSWSWDFGDGDDTNATMQNPVHTYNAAGTYTVNLTATNIAGDGTGSKTGYITVVEAVTPVANFSADSTSGDVPLTVQFTDESANNPTSWVWDFGDGSTSDQQNPSHRYIFAGNYTVTLTATNAGGSGTGTKTDYITVNAVERIELADSAWPKFGYDLNNSGQSPYAGPQSNNTVWTYAAGDRFYIGGSSIGSDGTIYIGNGDNNLYAFYPNGTVKWTYDTGGSCRYGTPAIDSDGVIYIGNLNDKLDAINPNGTLKWTYSTGETIYGTPAIGSDGIIYVGCRDGNLYALFPDGTLMWNYSSGGRFHYGSPAIGTDGVIYAGNYEDNKLYAIHPNGTLKWSYETGGRIYNAPAIAADGTVYVGSYDSNLYAIKPDGTLKWNYTTSERIYGAPAIAMDGTVYVGSYDTFLYAINPDGTLKWTYDADDQFRYSQPTIGSDGTVYIGDRSGRFYAISPEGTLKWDYTTGGRVYGPASIGSDGTLYLGGYDNNLYAFRDVVEFNAGPKAGGFPLTVQFTDESTGSPLSWAWDFGDGDDTNATMQNPIHVYTEPGIYNVTLTATYASGSSYSEEKAGYINVTNDDSGETAPIPGFTTDASSGPVPFTVQFTDTTTGNVSSLTWDFGDGATSDEQNPVHTYVTEGTHTVTLTATGPGGTDTATATMKVAAPLNTGSYDGGSPLLTVQEGNVSGGLWHDSWPGFSGYGEKTFTLPEHTEIKWARLYTDVYCGLMSGNKSFSMTIDIDADGDGIYELQKHDAGSIVYSNTPAWVNDHVNRVTSDYFMWYDLTDDINGTEVNIKATGGGSDGRIKHVTLVVAYDDGDEDEIHYWVNQGHDTANTGSYTGSTVFGTSALSDPDAVNLSTIYCASVNGAYTFNGESLSSGGSQGDYFGYGDWNVTEYFNSGQESTLTYAPTGSYYKIQVALLTASGTCSSGDATPVAEFSATPTSGDSPLTVQFTDTSTNSPTSWAWDFGDGDDTNATMQNPVHVYVSEGTYTVNLTATNAYGSDTEVKTDYITVTSGGSTNGVDLSIGGTVNTQPSSAVFVWEPNTVVVSGITNSGSVVAQNVTLALYASDVSGTEPVNSTVIASLTGNEVTVTLIDPTIREFEGEDVTYTAVLDPENAIAEDDESNNNLTSEVKSVRYNGYKGKGIYWAGSDNGGNITTKHTFNLTGDIISSTQPESAYKSTGWLTRTETWTAADLPIPATATVQKAYLYVSYNWDTTPGGVPNITTTFNGNTIDLGIPYTDKSNFGTYADYKYGLYPAVDVTSIFNVSGNNTFVMTPNTGNSQALYPSTLVVVYSDPTETRKLIFINEECDELGVSQSSYGTTVEEATAYVEFSGLDIDLSMVQNATLHSFAGSAGPNEGNLLFNGQSIATDAWQGTYRTVSTQSFDVKPYLSADGNVAGVQGTTSGGMAALQQILVVETNYTTLPVLSFMPADATVIDGQTTEIVISVDSLPAGLAGYNLTVDIGDRNVSTIVNITYPEWVSVSENSTLPRGSIYLKALDGNDTIQAGATDVVLATLTVKGRNPGITNVTLGIDRLDDDNGDEIEALLETGNLEVTLMTIPGQTASAQDLDGDGIYEDLTGDGSLSFVDVELFFHQMDWIETHLPIANFDFNGNGRIDFDDVVDLFQMVM